MVEPDEDDEFVERSRRRILDHARERRRAGYTDKLHAVVRSETGTLFDGIPFETSMPQLNFCAERHAINEMLYAEPDATLTDLLVATPAPDETADPPTPCGACRHAIHQFSDDGTVHCATFVREDEGWTMFPRLERYTADELYPDHRPHPTWE